MSSAPALSVVVVTYNSRSFIDRCLAPLQPALPDIEVIVWDNASSDGTADHVAQTYPWVKLVASQENLGFARGNNAAFASCRGRHVLLLNPDAFLTDASQLAELAGFLDANHDVAAVGPQLLSEDGTHQVGDAGWRVTPVGVAGHFLFLHRASPLVPAIYLTNPQLLERPFVDVDWVCGACMMVRASAITRTGGFDERIFMYGEDMEWGVRLRDAGDRVVYLPRVKVLHLQGASQRASGRAFYSTRYLDELMAVMAARYGRVAAGLMRLTMATGFIARAGAYSARAVMSRTTRDATRARNMFNYARHVLSSQP